MSETITVTSGYGITFSFSARKYGTFNGAPSVYFRLGKQPPSFNYSNPDNDGWVKLGTASALTTSCSTKTFSLPAALVGGQNLVLAIFCASSSNGTNGYSIDNLTISKTGPTALPAVNAATSWAEDFSTATWYNSDYTTFPLSYVKSGFRTKYTTTGSNIFLYNTSNGGADGSSVNYFGTSGNYYCQFNDYSDALFSSFSPYSSFVTQEINTSGCPKPTLRFAFKSEYPSGSGSNYSYTNNEDYSDMCPEIYYTTTDGYGGTWTQLNVNYNFPMGVWWYASVAVPSAPKIKFRFETGYSFTKYSGQKIDDIKILCNDCSISSQTAGTIVGPGAWLPNTEYTFNIDPTPTPAASYYKWIIRNKTSTPATIYYGTAPTSNPTNPVVISGQGTTTATINFGTAVSNPSSTFRVMCIPYDANPGTDISPNVDVCYANIGIYSCSPIALAPTSATSDRNNLYSDDSININLSLTGGSGTTATWYTGSCGGTEIGTGNPLAIVSPTETTTYYGLWETGCGETSCVSTTVTITPLPIKLLLLEALQKNDEIMIDWSTASETNNDFFTLEKSPDGEQWIPVEEIPGAGNSNQVRDYSYTDHQPLPGTSYYRLKQTDYDGRFEYFGPVSVNCAAEDDNSGITLFPNPAEDVVFLQSITSGAARVTLCDVTGRAIKDYLVGDLSVQTEISLKGLKAGIYLICIKDSASNRLFKIIKK